MPFQDFESQLLDVIYQFEQSITSFTSLLKEPGLQQFIDERETILILECDKEAMELSRSHEKPWPSVELLFGSDDEYQRYIADIVQHISVEIRNVEEYADVSICLAVNFSFIIIGFQILYFCISRPLCIGISS